MVTCALVIPLESFVVECHYSLIQVFPPFLLAGICALSPTLCVCRVTIIETKEAVVQCHLTSPAVSSVNVNEVVCRDRSGRNTQMFNKKFINY